MRPTLRCRAEKQIFTKGEPNGKVGWHRRLGPAGLSCADYLARLGYDVTVYERRAQPGGLDTYGMAEYKMPQAVLARRDRTHRRNRRQIYAEHASSQAATMERKAW
jgi:NADPH-dependent glutamate synthase beta subunit-like oxidoreductase